MGRTRKLSPTCHLSGGVGGCKDGQGLCFLQAVEICGNGGLARVFKPQTKETDPFEGFAVPFSGELSSARLKHFVPSHLTLGSSQRCLDLLRYTREDPLWEKHHCSSMS